MKVWIPIVALAFAAPLCAQDQSARPALDLEAAAKPSTLKTNLLSDPKPAQEPAKPLLTLSGLGPEIAKSTNRWRMFSLRRPLNPKEDAATLILDTRTEAARPVKLFSIDF